MTQLQKQLQEKGFVYKTMDIRNSDREYLNSLCTKAQEFYVDLEVSKSEKQKAVNCRLEPGFWDKISPSSVKEQADKASSDFDAYLKELSERYSGLFVEDQPVEEKAPVKSNYIDITKIPDKDLQ